MGLLFAFFCNPFRRKPAHVEKDEEEDEEINHITFNNSNGVLLLPVAHLHGDTQEIEDELSLAYTYDGDEDNAVSDYLRALIDVRQRLGPQPSFRRQISSLSDGIGAEERDGDG
uniref:Uncharacterized protein n=1 Tax=Grammatophora oceanica TaxID=210454 RepID=A0A7S1VRD5_9STRA|mmetsp:Transcript_53964/g.80507  ORF Transcript_53964/g.80507 Transcript_53964/m.80507 type:complete len:114 (+) Transcript_53964:298-639(+)